jgi:hypothetical protein
MSILASYLCLLSLSLAHSVCVVRSRRGLNFATHMYHGVLPRMFGTNTQTCPRATFLYSHVYSISDLSSPSNLSSYSAVGERIYLAILSNPLSQQHITSNHNRPHHTATSPLPWLATTEGPPFRPRIPPAQPSKPTSRILNTTRTSSPLSG